jgi:hypothetical protein
MAERYQLKELHRSFPPAGGYADNLAGGQRLQRRGDVVIRGIVNAGIAKFYSSGSPALPVFIRYMGQ